MAQAAHTGGRGGCETTAQAGGRGEGGAYVSRVSQSGVVCRWGAVRCGVQDDDGGGGEAIVVMEGIHGEQAVIVMEGSSKDTLSLHSGRNQFGPDETFIYFDRDGHRRIGHRPARDHSHDAEAASIFLILVFFMLGSQSVRNNPRHESHNPHTEHVVIIV